MPSSSTIVLPFTLIFSICPPVSVCGTDLRHLKFRRFSWKLKLAEFPKKEFPTARLLSQKGIFRKCGFAYTC
ncbi:hypothetical protein COT69_01655 [candidate division WWE3 bacterium CG09_land_8_20_14_0_10_39_24]|uniref:Uncharacterized protein n=1 Tax=candidate division WWE3 bacterium CG09_land_8_20_14_0_10_39_24 TaxID=1975088 RepID=A0A2H0WJY9_UNCKA|nr:MAG: hypothetical protein COT69_01655 [candidate division WWE3 bacterium CG09_land_8_20_14_0_10_39_24]